MAVDIANSFSLTRLIYFSRQAFSPHADREREVALILSTSRERNAGASISGLLLDHDGWFVQALEGPAQAVMTTYSRILRDPRHTGGRQITAGPVSKREFASWSMCGRCLSVRDEAILDTLSQREAFDPEKLSAEAALRLLISVKKIKDRVAA